MQSRPLAWSDLGDPGAGRPHLGPETSVLYYRLLQYSLREVLARAFGVATADQVLKEAGHIAGQVLYQQFLADSGDLSSLLKGLSGVLQSNQVAILRPEEVDEQEGRLVLTLAEDLDCSGTIATGDTRCKFDEGVLAGVLASFLGGDMDVAEVECWGTAQDGCRYEAWSVR